MRRSAIGLSVTLAVGILLAPLITNSRAAESTAIEAFHRGLQALGYVEGQNIMMEYRYADGKLEQLPQFAAELVQLNVAVIVTTGSPPTRAAQQATQTIPLS